MTGRGLKTLRRLSCNKGYLSSANSLLCRFKAFWPTSLFVLLWLQSSSFLSWKIRLVDRLKKSPVDFSCIQSNSLVTQFIFELSQRTVATISAQIQKRIFVNEFLPHHPNLSGVPFTLKLIFCFNLIAVFRDTECLLTISVWVKLEFRHRTWICPQSFEKIFFLRTILISAVKHFLRKNIFYVKTYV